MATKAEQRHHVDSGLAVLHAVRDQNEMRGGMSAGQIADAVGCSKQLIASIEKRALRKLRHPSRADSLKELMEAVV